MVVGTLNCSIVVGTLNLGSETGGETGSETGGKTGSETGDKTGCETGGEAGSETGSKASHLVKLSLPDIFFIYIRFSKTFSKNKAIIFELPAAYATQNNLTHEETKIEADFKVIREVSRKALNVRQSFSIPWLKGA